MPQAGEDHHAVRARARVGTVLDGKWHLDALLGVGGMASVYAATHRNGKRAAIKVLHVEAALNPSIRARFLREGYVANRVAHEGSVSILDDDTAPDGSVFLVMELLEGETVDQRWLRGGKRLDEAEVLTIVDHVLAVLVAAHGKQIVHRDLKPGNLFVTRDGAIKVLDFGIARLGDFSPDKASATTSFHSSMGTLGFMPPEQARGRWEQVDARTDLWALGATMFALLTGRHVHEAATANEQLLLAMTSPAPPIVSVRADVVPAVAEIVDKALRYQTSDRWESAQAMQQAVRDAYTTMTGRALSLAPRLVVVDPPQGQDGTRLEVEHAATILATSGSIGSMKGRRRPGALYVSLALVVVALVGVAAVRATGRRGGSAASPSTEAPPMSAVAAPPLPPAPAPGPEPDVATAPAPAPSVRSHSPFPSPAPTHPRPAVHPAASASAAATASALPAVDLFERRR
jgi:serine/threonine protein kinase